jgi:hypothetical protein
MSFVISPKDNIVEGRNADDEEIEINATNDRELAVKNRGDQLNELIEQNSIIIELLKSLNE